MANRMKQSYRISAFAVVLFLALSSLFACMERRDSSLPGASESSPKTAPPMPPVATSPTPALGPQPTLPANVPAPAEARLPTSTLAPTLTPRPVPTRPAVTDDAQEKLWELETELAGFVTPAVVDEIVYVGTENRMNALDSWTGETLWSFETAEIFWGTPLVADGAVYFGLPNRQVYALDAQTGTFQWAHPTQHDVVHMAIDDGVVYVFTEQNRLLALEASTGEKIWTYLPEGEASSPEVGEGVVYLSVGPRLVKLDALTGQELQRVDTGRFFQNLTLADGRLYGLPPFPDQPQPGTVIHALDPATGDVLWTSESNARVVASVSVAAGVAYVSDLSGHLSAYDAMTGGPLWRHQVAAENEEFVPPRAPTIIDGVVYYRSGLCCLHALDAATGQVLWQHQTDAVVSAPAVSDQGIIYVGATNYHRSWRGSVYALSGPQTAPLPALAPPDAEVAWMRQVASATLVLSEVQDGVVYAWSHDRHVYSFRAATGEELSRFPTGEAESHHLVELITDGVAYLALPNESARALDAADGATLWTYVNEDGRRHYTAVISAAQDSAYVGLKETLLALRSDTGEKLWSFHSVGTRGPEALVHDGVVYPYGSEYRHVYAVDENTGALLWQYLPQSSVLSPPVVIDDTLYVSSSDGAFALDAATGTLRWTYDPVLVWERAGDEFAWNFAPSTEPPLVADGMVYLGFVRGDFGETTDERYSEVHALDAKTGNLVWRLIVDGACQFLAHQDGAVFVTAEDGLKSVRGTKPQSELDVLPLSGYLHALDAATGNLIWSARTKGNPISPSVAHEGVLYAHSFDAFGYEHPASSSENGQVTAFSAATGETIWFYAAPFLTSMLLWPEAGIVLAAGAGGWVYALTEP